jgi:hypothetical protein
LRIARSTGAVIKKRCVVWRLKPVFPDLESKEATEIESKKEKEGRKKGRGKKIRKDGSKLTSEGRPEEECRRISVAYFRIFPRIECAFAFR